MPVPPQNLAVLALGAVLLGSCATPPPEEPRKAEVLLTGEAVDRDVGMEEAERVAAEMGLVEDAELVGYVNAVGSRLLRHAPQRDFRYRFHVVDQDVPNAFALPGGFVYVSRGLLALSNSEDELANVLAHEILHIAARHAAARQQIAQTTPNPLMLPGILLGAVFGESVGKAVAAPFQAFSAPYVASYSRDQERAADRGGQEIAAAAGYDPHGMPTFLRALEKGERQRRGFSRLPGFMDSHPLTTDRVGETATYADLLEWSRQRGVTHGRAGYLSRLDGLVVGESADQGVFIEERFLHPDLNFTIRFPEDWKLVNAPTMVGAISPDRTVQIFLSAPTPGTNPRVAAELFVLHNGPRLGIQVVEAEEMQIGELPAYRVLAWAHGPGGRVGSMLTWIAHEGRVYRVNAIAPAGTGRDYVGRSRKTAQSFRSLTPEELASIEENRLRVATAHGGESLIEFAERTGNVWSVHVTALMNDHPPGESLEEGQVLKIARRERYVSRRPRSEDASSRR
jgi:predicted Zn-dependent protease